METNPPPMMERIVRVLTPPDSREYVLGDLRERYVSPKHYLLDALTTVPSIVGTRLRRTQHPVGIALGLLFCWFGVFYGNLQSHWLVASIPTLFVFVAGALRDVYRPHSSHLKRSALIDVAVFAGSALLSQGIVALLAPAWLLSVPALVMGLPIGCVILFFVRLQLGVQPSGPVTAGGATIAMADLMREIRNYEAHSRRSVRIELGACSIVAALFTFYACVTADPIVRVGHALIALGALFIAGFMHRFARLNPMPEGLSFEEAIRCQRDRLALAARMLRKGVWWYVLPLSLGPAVLIVGSVLDEQHPWAALFPRLAMLAFVALLLQQLQKLGARAVDKRASELALVREKT